MWIYLFILWRVVIFNKSLAYFLFVTCTIRLLWIVFTVLGAKFAKRNSSIEKVGESFVIGFSSVNLKTMKLDKEIVAFSMLLSV